jgi:hypothetical protein
MALNILLAFLTDSYYFYLIISLSYFLCLDSVAIEDKNIIVNFNNFYYYPKTKLGILFRYSFYRISHSFLFNFLPALVVLFISILAFREIDTDIWTVDHEIFFYSLLGVWLFYILISCLVFIECRENNIQKNIIKALSYPFYFGIILVQLHNIKTISFKLSSFDLVFQSGFVGMIIILFLMFLRTYLRVQK